mmetsp:Transcript_5153/g.16199  ORF Transcript_5153/g.16199 Transcript_5153/m.16199 type:complete len:317 (+) Transcript_5153:2603-3553(+)
MIESDAHEALRGAVQRDEDDFLVRRRHHEQQRLVQVLLIQQEVRPHRPRRQQSAGRDESLRVRRRRPELKQLLRHGRLLLSSSQGLRRRVLFSSGGWSGHQFAQSFRRPLRLPGEPVFRGLPPLLCVEALVDEEPKHLVLQRLLGGKALRFFSAPDAAHHALPRRVAVVQHRLLPLRFGELGHQRPAVRGDGVPGAPLQLAGQLLRRPAAVAHEHVKVVFRRLPGLDHLPRLHPRRARHALDDLAQRRRIRRQRREALDPHVAAAQVFLRRLRRPANVKQAFVAHVAAEPDLPAVHRAARGPVQQKPQSEVGVVLH